MNGTNGESVYLTSEDYIDISTFLIFRLISTGMMDAAPDEIVILYPNGGESLTLGEEYTIKWKTYGSVSSVDLAYSTGSNPAEDDWNDIASGEVNVDSLTWSPVTISDSIRIRVRDPDSFDENVGKI